MEDVIKLAIEGDVDAFEQLVLQYEKLVYTMAYRMFNNVEDARDISQEVFIKVYRNITKYEGTAAFKTWIYTVCYNTCIDEMRKRGKARIESMDKLIEGEENTFDRQFVSNAPTPEQEVVMNESARNIQKAINKLSDEHREIIILRDINNLKYDEISQVTKLTLGTIKSRINRARKNLKGLIFEEQNDLKNV